MKTTLINIKELIQVEHKLKTKIIGSQMRELKSIKNAYLSIENDIILGFGSMDDISRIKSENVIDVKGKIILPTWCDSHTHIVFSGNREQEFVDRINGLTYEQIAKRGGGIINSAKNLANCSEEDLYQQSKKRVEEVIKQGTGALEIKSGYGLSKESELKSLRVIKRLKDNFPIPIKSTFLGAHAVPHRYQGKTKVYVDHIIKDILPEVVKENLADYIDVFCEKGYFSIKDTEDILKAGEKYELQGKVHVNQFNAFGGVKISTKHNALSVDHLEELNQEDIIALQKSETMPVALPLCSFFLSIPYTPARRIIDSNLPLALASDYNPGSTPSGNMNFVVATACIKMKMTPEEAINAATLNGAYAMGLEKKYGSIAIGKKANFIITKDIPSYNYIPYAFGSNHIDRVFINGKPYCQ